MWWNACPVWRGCRRAPVGCRGCGRLPAAGIGQGVYGRVREGSLLRAIDRGATFAGSAGHAEAVVFVGPGEPLDRVARAGIACQPTEGIVVVCIDVAARVGPACQQAAVVVAHQDVIARGVLDAAEIPIGGYLEGGALAAGSKDRGGSPCASRWMRVTLSSHLHRGGQSAVAS